MKEPLASVSFSLLKARYRGFQFSNELTLLLRHVVRLYAYVCDKAHEPYAVAGDTKTPRKRMA